MNLFSIRNLAGSMCPGKGFAFIPALLVFSLFLLLAFPVSVSAQDEFDTPIDSSMLILRDNQDSYILGPYAYVTWDPEHEFDFEQVAIRHVNDIRGLRQDAKLLNLGVEGELHWIVVSLQNKSSIEEWVLSFGNSFEGRTGAIAEIFIFDAEGRRKLLDAVPGEGAEGPFGKNLTGTVLPLSIPPGENALLVMYYIPVGGVPHLLPLKIVERDDYLQSLYSPFKPDTLFVAFFMLMIGFYAAITYLRKDLSYLLFVVFFFLQAAQFHYANSLIFAESGYYFELAALLLFLTVAVGLFMSKYFLGIDSDSYTQNYFIYGAAGMMMLAIPVLAIMPNVPVIRSVLLFVAPSAGMFTVVLIAYLQAQDGKYSGYQYALAWLVNLVGFCVTSMAAFNLFRPTVFSLNAYWLSMLPQALLLMAATVQRFQLLEDRLHEQKSRENREQASLARLKQSKESADQQRLLRVIEREREVMAELREREAQRTEEMRKAKEAADEANRAKSAFLAVVSHEIRTPMTGIMGMVRLLMDTKLSSDQHEYAETIQDSGDAMLALLNDILDFEKIESGKMDLEHLDFDLHRLINGVITLMSGHAAERNIYLKCEMGEEVPRYIKGDPTRLRQVLLNLAGNAIKFTTKGGVTLHVRQTVSADESNQNENIDVVRHPLYFAVEDTGVGISREAQKNLFNPFSQADPSISRKFGGTGLGLAICKRLIERMGGTISINSREGEGSTFFFSLMMEEGSIESAEEVFSVSREEILVEGSKLHILIVDDNYINQKVIVGLVEKEGHTTEVASTAEDAIRMLEEGRFDIVFMDVELPGMSGVEATETIRKFSDSESASIPVIALTGNIRDEDIQCFYEANMNGFVPKPINPEDLKRALGKVTSGDFDNPVVVTAMESPAMAPTTMPENPNDLSDLDKGQELHSTGTEDSQIQSPGTYVPNLSLPDDADISSFSLEGESDEEKTDESLEKTDSISAPIIKEQVEDMVTFDDIDNEEDDSFSLAMNAAEEPPATSDRDQPAPSDVFDMATIGTLKDSLGKDQLKELLDSLVEKSDEIVEALTEARASMDLQVIGSRAHELKGMAGNFGLVELSSLASKAEGAAKNNETDGLFRIIDEIPSANLRAKQALENWLAD